MKLKTSLVLALSIASSAAFARPTTMYKSTNDSITPATPEELHNLASTSGCSAGYADIGRSAQAKAVVVTNGHCTGGSLVARMAMVNVPTNKSFAIFNVTGSKVNVTATRLLYATLMDTDIALYELKETNADLQAKGLTAFPFYNGEAPVGTSVRVTSGYWKETQVCKLERKVHRLLEGFGSDISDPSIATNSFALSKDCNIRGGYSGTPVIDIATHTIIAMAFTGAEGNEACAEGNPCEVDSHGVQTYRKGVSYAARVDQLEDCLQDGEFKLSLPSCTLYKK